MMTGETRRLRPQRLILDAVDAYRLRTEFGAPVDLGALDDAGWERLAIRLGGLWPRPKDPLRLFLVQRDPLGAGVALEPPLELCVRKSASGYLLFFDLVRASGAPKARRDAPWRRSGLSSGDYALEVKSALFQPLTTRITLAAKATPEVADGWGEGAKVAHRLLLEPGFGYPFADGLGSLPTLLFGELQAKDPADLEDLRVQAIDKARDPQGVAVARAYRVDRRGEWALVIDDGALTYGDDGVGEVTVEVRRDTQTINSVDGVRVRRRRASRHEKAVQIPAP